MSVFGAAQGKYVKTQQNLKPSRKVAVTFGASTSDLYNIKRGHGILGGVARRDPRRAPDPILEIYQAFVFTANTYRPHPFPCPDQHPGPALRTGPPGLAPPDRPPPARGPRTGPPDRAPGAPERPPGPAPRTGVPDRHPGPGPPDRPLGPAARTGPPGRHPDRSPGLAPGTSVPLTPGRTDKFKEETLPRLNQTGESTSLNLRKCLGQRKPPIVFRSIPGLGGGRPATFRLKTSPHSAAFGIAET